MDTRATLLITCLAALAAACSEDSGPNAFASDGPDADTSTSGSGEDDGDDGTLTPHPDAGSSTGDGDGDGDTDGEDGGDGDGDGGGDGDGDDDDDAKLWECSNYTDVQDMLAWVNQFRESYVPHDRYSFTLGYHSNYSFPLSFEWDQNLADQAQAQADALAAGAQPPGSVSERLWTADANTGSWRLSFDEVPADWVEIPWSFGDMPFPLHKSHPSARKGLFYHDFGGDGPVIKRLGVGAALVDGPECHIWWSLQFSP